MKKPQSTIDTTGRGPDADGVSDLTICPRSHAGLVTFTISGLSKEDLLEIKSCVNALLSCYPKKGGAK